MRASAFVTLVTLGGCRMSEQRKERSEESLRHEYSEVVQNLRHYSNLRFAIFTIFFAVMGGIGFVAFGREQFDANASLVARIAGFAVVAVFWLYLERTSSAFEHFRRVAMSLERDLDYTQWLARRVSTGFIPRAIVINRVLFFLLILLWAYAAVAVPLER